MLATVADAPLHPRAVDLAIEVAADGAARLVLVDVVDAAAGRRGAAPALPRPSGAGSLRAAAERAAAAGVAVTTIRGPSVRPVATLVDVVAEHRPRLLVFGPDPSRLSPWRGLTPRRHARALRVLDERTTCLLWSPACERRVSADTMRRTMAALAALARSWPAPPPRPW